MDDKLSKKLRKYVEDADLTRDQVGFSIHLYSKNYFYVNCCL